MSVDGLSSALSGLSAAQQQLTVIAGNVSNASTTGYTRKILPQEAQTIDGITVGVTTDPITRNVDLDLEKEFWTQQSSVSALNTQATYLNQIQQFNGPPNSQSTIAAKISALKDAFASLSDDPGNTGLQGAVVTAAQDVAGKLNDFGDLVTNLRNNAQTDMQKAVADINNNLKQIATLNGQIKFSLAAGKTVAALEDSRDQLINNLSQDISVTSFTRADGVMVIQTAQGVELADTAAQAVTFKPAQITATSYYPASAAGVFVGDPTVQKTAIDITGSSPGGKLGALIDLRDTALPQQQASLDEMAEQLAQRFDQQGLRLFTDAAGNIPADTAPNPVGPAPVAYVGFASAIQVSSAVGQNHALVQQGTVATDQPVPTGSNEVIRRITDFTFGSTDYQQANGAVNLNAPVGTDLQTWLGMYSGNQITGAAALSNYSTTAALIAAGGTTFNGLSGPPFNDQMTLTFSELRGAAPGSATVSVSLSQANTDFPLGGAITNAADQIAAEINKQVASSTSGASGLTGATGLNTVPGINTGDEFTVALGAATQKYIVGAPAAPGEIRVDTVSDLVNSINATFTGPNGMTASLGANGQLVFTPASTATTPALSFTDNTGTPTSGGLNIQPPVPAALAASASVNAYGQLVIKSRGDIDVEAGGANGMGQAGLTYLGLTAGVQKTTDPYISVQVGADPPVRISIIPGEDQAGLVASLDKTSGVDPGVPGLGAAIDGLGHLILRPGDSTANPTFGGDLTITGGPFQADGSGTIPGGITAGTSIVAALFGGNAPVSSVPYALANASGPATPFRTNNLGPGANISTGIASDGSLIDYSQQVINGQAQQANDVTNQQTNETTYASTLQQNLQNSDGVNIDQELSNMIVAQTAYSASARVISAIQAEFQALLQAF
jgi:flagellar hook-associated protein 1